ncbi:hypothetical protein [Agromyces cerinus]|uniref:Uncharacterized protein n=1 Tax=Agromyces cerinus subsp. cerinus TaxID=232089 RepID=A0A1N6DP86_9MICO|nr:hypothetical protein [Agromyces cerinus]SIN72494.1 hypothetical protein SAMN05443544_0540 [Agromyces cerinus subsp. cerinus]
MSWARDVWPSERARLMSMMPIEREAFEESRMVLELFRELNKEHGTVECQSPHRHSGCSVEVAYRARDTHSDWRFICQSAADSNARRVAQKGYSCIICLAPAEDCWEQFPV